MPLGMSFVDPVSCRNNRFVSVLPGTCGLGAAFPKKYSLFPEVYFSVMFSVFNVFLLR